MPIDSSIAMSGRQFQMDNPLDVQNRVATLRQLAGQQQLQQMQIQAAQRAQEQETTLSDLYKGNVNTDGTINRQGVMSGAAQRGLGSRIPGMQKQFAEADEATNKNTKLKSEITENDFNLAKKRMEVSAGVLQSMLARPNLTHQDVIDATAGLVNQGLIPAEQGQQLIRALPGDPVALRQYLMQQGMAVLDAKARLEALTPKFDKVNSGKVTSFVDTNTLTNPGGPKSVQMTTTPGEDQSAATSRRGQNMTDARAREANGIAQQAARTQVVEGPDGFMLVDKGTGLARPAATMNGAQVQGKSSMTEDQAKASGWLAQATNAWTNMQNAMGGIDPKTGGFKNPGVARPGVADAIGNIPSLGIGEVIGNNMRSPDRQKFIQASSSLGEAVLRAATGAGVNRDEALQKVRELTPVFGEDAATTKQKMESIPVYLNALRMRAGPGARKVAPPSDQSSGGLPPEVAAALKKHGGK